MCVGSLEVKTRKEEAELTVLHSSGPDEVSVSSDENSGRDHSSESELGSGSREDEGENDQYRCRRAPKILNPRMSSRSDSSDLTEEVQPSDDPSDDGSVLPGSEPSRSGVDTSAGLSIRKQ